MKDGATQLTSAIDRAHGFWLPRQVTVDCASAQAITRRPLKETVLWLRGARRLTWRDRRQAVHRKLIVPPLHELVTAIVGNLLMVGRARGTLRALEGAERIPKGRRPPSRKAKGLYLRTDHWFGLTGGGSVAHTSGVVNGLRDNGVDLSVVSTDRLFGVAEDEGFSLLAPRYDGRAVIKGAAELAYNDEIITAIDSDVASGRYDFVYQRSSYMNYAGAAMSVRHGLPFVCEFNGPLRWVGENWDREFDLLGSLSERIETLMLNAADIVVVVSDVVRDLAVERGVAPERVLVNPNGVDTDVYRPDIDASELRASFGLKDKVVLGFIGTFGEWHGADKLAEAYVRLRTERPDLAGRVHLLMVGNGPTRARAQAIVEKAGAGQAATFTGLVPQAEGPRYLAASDILVSPHVQNPDGSRFFGSPTKLFEYMSMGRGIVASDLDQIGEVLAHEKTALMVKPGQVRELAIGMARLIDDAPLRDRLGRAARAAALERHTWRAHTARIMAALERGDA